MSFIYKFLLSSKIKNDIQINFNSTLNSLKPIDIKNISLIAPIKKKLLKLRKKNTAIQLNKEDRFLSLIVPYRHREEHLKIFLPTIKNYLEKQNIKYEIIIVEQVDTLPFNKAKLMNIGAFNSTKESSYLIFHDVDLLPENIDYHFKNHTTKLFNFIKKDSSYKEYGETTFGGAVLISKEIFYDINGFSNNYWQWGKEDDDFLMRHLFKGYIPFLDKKGRFLALEHEASLTRDVDGDYKEDKSLLKRNKQLYKDNKRNFSNFKRGLLSQDNDGINSLQNYTIESTEAKNSIKTIKVNFTKLSR